MLIEDFQPEGVQWCDICRTHQSGHCDGCQKPVTIQDSYRSQSHHFHPTNIDGNPGHFGINKILCRECYLKDFAAVYPNEPLPQLGELVIPEGKVEGLVTISSLS
jgi:hypothetical protein